MEDGLMNREDDSRFASIEDCIEECYIASKLCYDKADGTPVCYQYFCDAIFDNGSTAEFRYAIKVLSNLVNYVGKNALNRRHIVELGTDSELKRVNLARFEKRLSEAAAAFECVRSFIDGDKAKLAPTPILQTISRPSVDLPSGTL
jgi:hypothetical protein